MNTPLFSVRVSQYTPTFIALNVDIECLIQKNNMPRCKQAHDLLMLSLSDTYRINYKVADSVNCNIKCICGAN